MTTITKSNNFNTIPGDFQIGKAEDAMIKVAESAFYAVVFPIAGPVLFVVNRSSFDAMLAKHEGFPKEVKQAFQALYPRDNPAPGVPKKVEKSTLRHRVGVFLDTHAETIAKVTLIALSTYYAISMADKENLDSSVLFKRILIKGLIELGWAKMVGHYRLSALTISHIFALNLSVTEYLKWSAVGTAVELVSREGIRYLARELV